MQHGITVTPSPSVMTGLMSHMVVTMVTVPVDRVIRGRMSIMARIMTLDCGLENHDEIEIRR